MDGAEKGKNTVIVAAIIAAVATIAVPLVNHFLPPGDKLSDKTSTVTQPPAQNETKNPSSSASRQITDASYELSPEAQMNVALGREYLRVGKSLEATVAFGKASLTAPKEAKWHACVAELSISLAGHIGIAEDEFDAAVKNGRDDLASVNAKLHVNQEAVQRALDMDGKAVWSPNDLSALVQSEGLELPGSADLFARLCAKYTSGSVGVSQNTKEKLLAADPCVHTDRMKPVDCD